MRSIVFAMLLAAPHASAQDGLSLRGEVVQGNLLFGMTDPGAGVRFDERVVRVSRSGAFVIGIAPDRTGHAPLRIDLRDGRRIQRTLAIAPREYAVRQLRGLREPEPGDERAFQARLDAIVRRNTATAHFERGFERPVRGAITSPFGVRRMLDGIPSRHWGVDFAAPIGHPVRAPCDGVIVLDATGPIFGRTLVIDHGHGLTSSLLHLSSVRVREGDRVRRGAIVAASGASGRITGPHLDWRIQLFGVPLDPLSALP